MKLMTNLKAAIILCCFFSTSSVFAAPSILNASAPGALDDGTSITITGSGFGNNTTVGTSALEFLGGKNGPIESGTVGQEFSRTHWNIDTEWGNDIQVTTNNVPWGTKVLQMTGPYTSSGSGNPEAPLYYNLPAPITSSDHLFVSWWQRTTFGGSGQYKIIRFSETQTIIDSPGRQDVYFFHNNQGGISYGINGGPYALYPSFSPATPQSTWARMDIDIKTSSPNSVTITKYTPGSAIQTISANSYSSSASTTNLNWIVWQNYFGTDADGNMTSGDLWFKDIYISHGTPARVELCDSSSWSARKQCQIQYPTSWNDTTIQMQLNLGSFASNSSTYLFVIDANGNASSGRQITTGSGGSGSGGGNAQPSAPLLSN